MTTTISQHDHMSAPVSSFQDGVTAWALYYHDNGPTRFEQAVEADQDADELRRQLEDKAVSVYLQRERELEAQRANQTLVNQLISALEQGAWGLCSPEQQEHIRKLITKRVEK